MTKITFTRSTTPDTITRSENIFTLNGVNYNLSDTDSLPTHNAEVDKQEPVHTKDGDIHIHLNLDKRQFDKLSHGNLKRVHDLSYREIAGILGVSEKAVESLLVRARRTLMEKISDPPQETTPRGVQRWEDA